MIKGHTVSNLILSNYMDKNKNPIREISYNVDCSLATVERDIKHIREQLTVQKFLSENKNSDMLP